MVWLDSDQDLEVAGLGEVDVDNVDLVLHPRLLPCQTQGAHPVQDSHDDVATDEELSSYMSTSELIVLPDGVGEEPEPWAHVRVPGHQMVSSCKNICISSKIDQS